MTLLTPPGYLQGGTYTALLDRMYAVTTLSQRDPSLGHGARQGFYPDRFPTYSNPSAMNWSVGPCAGVIANTFTTDGGDYRFANPTNATGSFAASSPTLNRHDILGFQVKDNFYDSSGLNSVIPAVIQGTGSAGTPVDPSLPSSFIPIVRAVINAAATSPTLQDLRTRTVVSGAVLPVDSVTQRTALGNMHSGFTTWRTDNLTHEVADGAGNWRIPGLIIASSNADLVAKVTTPYNGQLAFRTDVGRYVRYNSTAAAWHLFADGTLVARHTRTTAGPSTTDANGVGVVTLDVAVLANRRYRVEVPACHVTNTNIGSVTMAKINRTIDGSAPTVSSTILEGAQSFGAPEPSSPVPLVGFITPGANLTLRLMVSVGRTSGSGNSSIFIDSTRVLNLLVWDLGFDPGSTGTNL